MWYLKKAKLSNSLLIVGSGLAAYTLVREIRKINADKKITLVTADAGHYYSKPQLSTALVQRKTPEQLIFLSAAAFAEQFNVEILPHTVVQAIEPSLQQCQTTQGILSYAQLVLACGAMPVKLPQLTQAFVINQWQDYQQFRQALMPKAQVAIIGAGLVGCEFAQDLISTGYAVTVIAPEAYPLARLVPAPVGQALQRALAEKGVVWKLGHSVSKQINPHTLLLDEGTEIEADVILSAVGLQPMTTLAAAAGLAIDKAITVDAYLQTSKPNIYALGDCASVEGQWLPYIGALSFGAKALAATLTGTPQRVKYPPMQIYVKTAACPVIALPPPDNLRGEWKITTIEEGVRGLFYDENHRLRGFALAGAAARMVSVLMKEI